MTLKSILTTSLLALLAAGAHAGVPASEAARLKTELTPLGAEKAGNKDGSIPAWTGGHTSPIPGDKPGGRRGDPFKDEKPLFSISAQNMAQYADKLSEGQRLLLSKYPEYRLDVYKSHRTAAAPQWVYDNTFKNATRGRLDGDLPRGVFGGIPFPVPKTGAEVIWNHMLRWRGTDWAWQANQYQLTTDGRHVLASDGMAEQQMPYYRPDGSPEQFEAEGGFYWKLRLVSTGPAIRAGEGTVGTINLDGDKDQAWVYLAGQRRTRKLPNSCCDTPTPAAAGVMSFDEIETWFGRLDRFDWKLLGKQEMYIPYNNNRLLQARTDAEVLTKFGLNPNFMRWELHRVWVVEATLRAGQRHQAPKSRYYCDEDTWLCTLGDRWDAKGQFWKTLWTPTIVAPDLPGTIATTFGFNDLLSGAGYIGNLYNSKNLHYALKPRYPNSVFTPEALAGEGVR